MDVENSHVVLLCTPPNLHFSHDTAVIRWVASYCMLLRHRSWWQRANLMRYLGNLQRNIMAACTRYHTGVVSVLMADVSRFFVHLLFTRYVKDHEMEYEYTTQHCFSVGT